MSSQVSKKLPHTEKFGPQLKICPVQKIVPPRKISPSARSATYAYLLLSTFWRNWKVTECYRLLHINKDRFLRAPPGVEARGSRAHKGAGAQGGGGHGSRGAGDRQRPRCEKVPSGFGVKQSASGKKHGSCRWFRLVKWQKVPRFRRRRWKRPREQSHTKSSGGPEMARDGRSPMEPGGGKQSNPE
jgi:hypothetical protein